MKKTLGLAAIVVQILFWAASGLPAQTTERETRMPETKAAPLPPVAPMKAAVPPTCCVQATPCWVTVKTWPAIVIVPVRVALFGFASVRKVTVPGPSPPAPPVR